MSYSKYDETVIKDAWREVQEAEDNKTVFDIPYIPMSDIEKILKEFGIEFRGEHRDTNGWDLDFWQYFFVDDVKYCLAGSWYYGKYTLSKD